MFPRTRKNYFPKTGNIFPRSEKILEEREKLNLSRKTGNQKAMVKILARKLILCELPRLHYKYKNKRKRL